MVRGAVAEDGARVRRARVFQRRTGGLILNNRNQLSRWGKEVFVHGRGSSKRKRKIAADEDSSLAELAGLRWSQAMRVTPVKVSQMYEPVPARRKI